jgi:flagellar hook assembly protein FlgD
LGQNVPNPFSGRTVIHYEIPHDVSASVRIYDLAGQLVRSLAEGDHEAGLYVVEWDGTDRTGVEVPPGIYFSRLSGGDLTLSRKMVVMR